MNKICSSMLVTFFILLTSLWPSAAGWTDEILPALPEDNLYYPVIIQISNGETRIGIGSGFFLNTDKFSYFVTAKHILYTKQGALNGNLAVLRTYTSDSSADQFMINLQQSEKNHLIILHPTEDLALIKLGWLTKDGDQTRIRYYQDVGISGNSNRAIIAVEAQHLKRLEDVHVGNDVFIFGYPASLQNPALGIDFTKPILRKGVVAGKDAKSNKIILDAPVYFGNSGGLVIEAGYNVANPLQREFRPIGIVLEMVPFLNEFKNQEYGYSNYEVENSGYSIALSMDALIDLVNHEESASSSP